MATEKRYLALIYSALFLAVFVVGLGVFTRLTDAGLGCPDWPGCYGFLSVAQLSEKMSEANNVFPAFPVEIQKAWNEMLHRYAAGLLGLMIAVIAFLAWRVKERNRAIANTLLILVIFQAALGMWTVTLSLMPIIVMAHLLAGFTTVSLLLLLAVIEKKRSTPSQKSSLLPLAKSPAVTPSPATFPNESFSTGSFPSRSFPNRSFPNRSFPSRSFSTAFISSRLKIVAVFSLVAVVMQIALGGWTSANYAALVCSQLPICEVDWILKFDVSAFNPISPSHESYQYGVLNFDQRVTIHVTHRIGAMLVSLLLLWLAFEIRKPLGNWSSLMLVCVLTLQISLGITNVQAFLPLPAAVAHNLCGLLLLLLIVRIVVNVFDSERHSATPVLRLKKREDHG